jgi:hypothetical protein
MPSSLEIGFAPPTVHTTALVHEQEQYRPPVIRTARTLSDAGMARVTSLLRRSPGTTLAALWSNDVSQAGLDGHGQARLLVSRGCGGARGQPSRCYGVACPARRTLREHLCLIDYLAICRTWTSCRLAHPGPNRSDQRYPRYVLSAAMNPISRISEQVGRSFSQCSVRALVLSTAGVALVFLSVDTGQSHGMPSTAHNARMVGTVSVCGTGFTNCHTVSARVTVVTMRGGTFGRAVANQYARHGRFSFTLAPGRHFPGASSVHARPDRRRCFATVRVLRTDTTTRDDIGCVPRLRK